MLLLLLGAALGFQLGRNPISPMFVAAGCVGIVAVLALAILRYDAAVALGILLLPVVRAEPAPVDAVLAIVIAVAAVTNRLELRRVPLSMLALCSLFIALNLLASMEALQSNIAARYLSVTIYCIAIGFWICGYVDSEKRARLVIKAYIVSAVLISVASSLALFVKFPNSNLLLTEDFDRARGLFKDPNVYGPYLIPAALIFAQESLRPRLLQAQPADPDLLLRRAGRRHPVLLLARRVAEPGDRRARDDARDRAAPRRLAARVHDARGHLVRDGRHLLGRVLVRLAGLPGGAGEASRPTTTSGSARRRSACELAEENPIGIGPGQFELVAPLSAHSTYVRAVAEEGVLGAADAGRADARDAAVGRRATPRSGATPSASAQVRCWRPGAGCSRTRS